jgi:hypothetical protein
MNKKMKLTIIIDGESARNLFAVGPNDLKNYFLPEFLQVDSNDVKTIYFQEDLTPEEFGETIGLGKDLKEIRGRTVHKDNYSRPEQD